MAVSPCLEVVKNQSYFREHCPQVAVTSHSVNETLVVEDHLIIVTHINMFARIKDFQCKY